MKEACVIALFDVDGHLLMGRRRDSGKFVCPGGHLEPGEIPAAAAVRECREEAGFDPHDLEPLASFTIQGREGANVLVHAFRARVPQEAVPTNANDPDEEFSELFYVDTKGGLPDAITHNLHHDPDVCLQYLGLVKPQADINVLERGEAYLQVEDLQKMALRDILPGKRLPSGNWDYSHLLSPAHRSRYRIEVREEGTHRMGHTNVESHLLDTQSGRSLGRVVGHFSQQPDLDSSQNAEMFASSLAPELRNHGLGKALYESWMKHAHTRGQTHIKGDSHSTAAHQVHQSLAAKHGMTYSAPRTGRLDLVNQASTDRPIDNNGAFDNYKYALKSELMKSEFKATPEQITEAIRKQGLSGAMEDAIPTMNAAQLKAVTDVFVKSKVSTLHPEAEAKMIRNPYLSDEPRAILMDRAHKEGATRYATWTAPHISDAEARQVWDRTPPHNRRAAVDLPNVKTGMIDEMLNDETQHAHLSPHFVGDKIMKNPNVKPADIHRWLGEGGPEPTRNLINYGSAHVYGLVKPELRDAIWKHMGPIIEDRLRNDPSYAGRWFSEMNEDHARQVSAAGFRPDMATHGDLTAQFHGLGLPIKGFNGIEVRPGTDKLRALRDFIGAQPGQSVPVRVLKAKQMDLGVRGDARGNVGVDHVQAAIDGAPARKYVTGADGWTGPQRHTEPQGVEVEQHHRNVADTMEAWRDAAELHGAASPEATAAQKAHEEAQRAYAQAQDAHSDAHEEHDTVQQHVFQLGVHPDAINEMRKRGVLDAFHKLVSISTDSGHPAMPYGGIGWVRYDHHPDGIHVDEIQSDFDHQTLKQLAANPESTSELLHIKPEDVKRTVSHIGEVLWGSHHPSDVIHEAFQQHLRNEGHEGLRIHHWQLGPKAKIAGLNPDEPMPGHFQHTYDQAPKKQWGYEPALYGKISAQTNEDLHYQPTWSKKLQKFGPDLDAWYAARLTKSGSSCDPAAMELNKSAGKRLIALAAATAMGAMAHPEHAAIPEWRPSAQVQQAQNFSAAPPQGIPAWRQQVGMTAPDAPQSVGAPMVGTPWTPKGLSTEMHPIAHLESAWGKHLSHERCPGGDFHTAFGALGFKPSTAHEQYKRSKLMQKAYPGLDDQGQFMERFREDPHFYNAMANNHWAWLKNQVGGDPHKAAFGWRWGIGAATQASENEIGDDDYVQHYAALSGTGKPAPAPTMLVAKAEQLPDFYEIE